MKLHFCNMKRKTLLLLLTFLHFYCLATFDMNRNMQNSYSKIINLQFNEGYKFIELERESNPNNGLIHLNENYKDFLTIIIGESKQEFDSLYRNKKKRLIAISKCDRNSPYYLYAQAEINLQWAFARIKFQEYFLAAYEIQKAYFLLKENKEKYPEFYLNNKGIGLLNCIIGSVPNKFKWIVNLIGIDGDIESGINTLHDFLIITEKVEKYRIYNTELLFLISFLEMNLTIERSYMQRTLDSIEKRYKEHILLNFAAARLSSRLGYNKNTIQILESRPDIEGQYNFWYLDYLLGMSKLYQLDQSAKDNFLSFINNHKGENYIKSAYQKLAWISFLQGDSKKMSFYFTQATLHGKSFLDEDIKAQKDAQRQHIAHPLLLEARLLYDGGYYEHSLNRIQKIQLDDLSNIHNLLEYWYRLARIQQKKMEPSKKIIDTFTKVVSINQNSDAYYTPMSVLQIAFEYERLNDKAKAKYYYQKCLEFKNFDYERGIHQKAKVGLSRLLD